jgi:hypothetical protein
MPLTTKEALFFIPSLSSNVKVSFLPSRFGKGRRWEE